MDRIFWAVFSCEGQDVEAPFSTGDASHDLKLRLQFRTAGQAGSGAQLWE